MDVNSPQFFYFRVVLLPYLGKDISFTLNLISTTCIRKQRLGETVRESREKRVVGKKTLSRTKGEVSTVEDAKGGSRNPD